MYQKEMDMIYCKLKENLLSIWDGKESILYMKNNSCHHWRQMEWAGFYFQFMCEKILSENDFMKIPGPRYGNVEFDGFKSIPWDFKVHSIDRNKNNNFKIPTNGYNEVKQAINQYGTVGFIIINGYSDYDDEEQTFKKWHDILKGGKSEYEKKRIIRGASSRRRKINFQPFELVFVLVNSSNINTCGKFQTNFRNADGTSRNSKVMLDLKKNDKLIIHKYDF